VLLLAIAGLYALMSFTVVRRRREFGIRIALGARPHPLVGGVLRRAAWQLAIGMAAGLAVTGVVDRLSPAARSRAAAKACCWSVWSP
jgi:ABC-type antimicrobial peptide transport system permease subunit